MTTDEALDALLGDQRTGNMTADLVAAAREAMRRRQQNTRDGGSVIAALLDQGMTYREIERVTGIPRETARRWAIPPTQYAAEES